MNKKKTALVLGSFIGLVHLVWSLAIALGFAQAWMDFVYRMHSLNNPFTVGSFDLWRSIGLIVLTFAVGNVVGYVFATLWNHLHK